MNSHHRRLIVWTGLVAVAACLPAAIAAQQNPFDTAPVITSPTVRAIVDADPQTPAELIRAVGMLLDLDQDELAKPYLDRLAAQELTPQQWFELYREAGPEAVFRIANRDAVQPQGADVAQRILGGAEQHAIDPDRINQLANQVTDDDIYVRSQALTDLRLLSDTGAAALINLLADESRQADWPRLRAAVRYFGTSAEEPLLALLRSNELRLQVEAARALRHVPTSAAVESLYLSVFSPQTDSALQRAARDSLQQLSGRLPSRSEAEARLKRSAEDYLMDRVVMNQDAMDPMKWWRWDAETRSLQPRWMITQTVARIRAFRRARDLFRLQPDRPDNQLLFWLTRLESAKLTSGIDQPLPDDVLQRLSQAADADLILDVLDQALGTQRIPAAIAACEVLARAGNGSLLIGTTSAPSPLVEALDQGSPRLTHAASQAIAALDPQQSFVGSSRYVDALFRLAHSRGVRKVIVGHVNRQTGQTLTAALQQSGFTADAVTQSRAFYELASSDPDVELLVLTDTLSRPGFSGLLQSLRANPQTRRLPIIILVESENAERAQRLALRYDRTLVRPFTLDASYLAQQIAAAMDAAPDHRSTAGERREFAQAAMAQLVRLADHPGQYPYFDLVNRQELAAHVINTPGLAAESCRLLSRIGTADAQRNLLSVANNDQLPDELRQIAAKSFADAVDHRGIMLTRDQILTQYNLYNASAQQPVEVQKIFGSILDVLEKKAD